MAGQSQLFSVGCSVHGPAHSASVSGWVLVWFLSLSLDPSVDTTTTTTRLTQDHRVRRYSLLVPWVTMETDKNTISGLYSPLSLYF